MTSVGVGTTGVKVAGWVIAISRVVCVGIIIGFGALFVSVWLHAVRSNMMLQISINNLA